jgi:hypothetical protein
VIPESTYYPLVATGNYSTTAFLAKETDLPMTVYPPDGVHQVFGIPILKLISLQSQFHDGLLKQCLLLGQTVMQISLMLKEK